MNTKGSAYSKRPTLISIQGNIGSGKSTLVQILKERGGDIFNGKRVCFLPEPVDQWVTIVGADGNYLLIDDSLESLNDSQK